VSPGTLTGTLEPEQVRGARRRLLVYLGPATLVSVGYVDPGNWASDLEGGARFGQTLLWVLVAANAIALLMQTLAARLGVVARMDLAQACRAFYPRSVTLALWVMCQIAIVACDLAEVIGSAVALNLLFGLPLLAGAAVTVADVLMLLALQRFGMRKLEAVVLVLLATVGTCLACEFWLAGPSWEAISEGLRPRLTADSVYVAVAMLGATVMPHNLYLHSWLVQTRAAPSNALEQRRALRWSFIDTLVALNVAFFINAAILTVAADVFGTAGLVVTDLRQAQALLSPLLGTALAGVLFAVALLCAGQSSTITGTLAGQVVMEGFLGLRGSPARMRLATRCAAIVPAVVALGMLGDDSTVMLLLGTQVVLSIQLPFALVPLIAFTSSRRIMGAHASHPAVTLLAGVAALLVIGCNAWLVMQVAASLGASVRWALILAACAGAALLVYLAVAPSMQRAEYRAA
jgi:manganese transport protein